VVLRLKKLEIREKKNCENCIRATKKKKKKNKTKQTTPPKKKTNKQTNKQKQILCHEIEPNPSKDRALHEGDNPSF
jgi:hypothetical protein